MMIYKWCLFVHLVNLNAIIFVLERIDRRKSTNRLEIQFLNPSSSARSIVFVGCYCEIKLSFIENEK